MDGHPRWLTPKVRALALRALNGDDDALAELLISQRNWMLGKARSKYRSSHDEELVDRTIGLARGQSKDGIPRFKGMDGPADLRRWLGGLLKGEASNMNRTGDVGRAETRENSNLPQRKVRSCEAEADFLMDLEWALKQLPPDDRLAVKLLADGWTYRDIAAVLSSDGPHLTERQVEYRINRARRALRALLNDGDES